MSSFELASAQLDGDWRGPPGLTVLYDERCPLCRRLKAWLRSQPALVPIEFVPANSSEARARYPHLDHERTKTVLTVVATNGAVYEGERAWLACAWTLPRWQSVAEHLGSRPTLLVVRVAAKLVDRHRRQTMASPYRPRCDTCRTGTSTPAQSRGYV
jgi:predicted DCC family thiol-disulfide oxidoreductase YuxK